MGSDLDVLEDMETVEREESEDGDGPRVKRTRQVYPSEFSSWSIMLRKPEPKQRDSREYRFFSQTFRHPYKFLIELAQLAKHRKWFSLVTKDVVGRQCDREAVYAYL